MEQAVGWVQIADREALSALAPDAMAALGRLTTGTASAEVAAARAAHPVVDAYAEQFIVDVANLTDDQRAATGAALAGGMFAFVQALWVVDLGGRVDDAWLQLFGIPSSAETGPGEAVDLWPAIDAFLVDVAKCRALDPLTSELVRLRGARAHDCRLCQSLRSVRAVEAGADESTFDAIDQFEQSDFTERQKVSLRLVDAMIWQPAAYPAELAEQVRAEFTPIEAVEIVLDVMRNAANKIAVAFRADGAHVTEGVEYYDVDDDGQLVYGLTI